LAKDGALLEVSAVEASYGQTPVLRGVSLSLDRGETVSIVGRNGVGKSTLVKTIMGLLRCKSGSITFDGVDVTKLTSFERARRGIGYVPQGRLVFPQLTVRENLRLGTMALGTPVEESLNRIYEYFPTLKTKEKKRAVTLSGGEQQMLAIGRALAGDPALLLLDEPSEGLQPSVIQGIAEKLEVISLKQGRSVLLVEQNLELVIALSKRCFIMEKGNLTKELASERLQEDSAIREHLAL